MDTVAVAMVATKVDTVADSVVVKVVKLATPAVVMVTCLVCPHNLLASPSWSNKNR